MHINPPGKYGVPTLVLILSLLVPTTLRAQDATNPTAPAPEKKSPWERSASLGLTLTRGNSDTLLFTADAKGLRKWDKNELSLGADAAYGENEDTKTAEAVHGFGQFNRLFTDRAFGYFRVDALHDSIADVDYRLTLGPGAGYYFIKNPRTTLSGEAGPSFIFEKQGGDEHGYVAARIAERFEYKLNDRARIWEMAEFLPQVDDLDNFIVNAEAGIEASLTKKLSLRAVIQDTYDNEPAPGRKENDLKLITSVALKF